jgi:hypothetical protein
MATKSQPADWDALLSGIKAANPALEYTAKREIFTKQKEAVMTPQMSPRRLSGPLAKTSLHLLQQTGRLSPSIGQHSSQRSRVGKPLWNTARTARSMRRETLRIPCGISKRAR